MVFLLIFSEVCQSIQMMKGNFCSKLAIEEHKLELKLSFTYFEFKCI